MDTDVPASKNAIIIEASLRNMLSSFLKTEEPLCLQEVNKPLSACRAIQSAATAIRTSVPSQWNANQRINQLPNEVLHEILQSALVASKVGYIRRPPAYFTRQQVLRRVSSHWNQIILSSPYFWNTLCCIDVLRKRYKIALEKSKNVGLHVFCRPSKYCRFFANRMSEESHRWIALDILYDGDWEDNLSLPTPRLKSIIINGDGWVLPSFPTEHARGLSVVFHHAADFSWNTAPVTGLRSLEIKAVSPAPDLEHLLGIVDASPYLESMTIDDMYFPPRPTSNIRKIAAPNLRYISSHSLSTSETIIDFLAHLIIPPTTSVHLRMYAGDIVPSIPQLIYQLFGYVCERIQLLDEAFSVGLQNDIGHWRGLALECPPTNPTIKVRFGWSKDKLRMEGGVRAIADRLESAFRGRRELRFSPERTSVFGWSLSNAMRPWSQGLARLSTLAIPNTSWALDLLADSPSEGAWAYPNLQHLRLLGGEWQSKLVELVKNRRDEPTVKSIERIILEGVKFFPQNTEELQGLVTEVVVC